MKIDLNLLVKIAAALILCCIYILGLTIVVNIIDVFISSSLIDILICFCYGFMFGWYGIRIYKFLEIKTKQYIITGKII